MGKNHVSTMMWGLIVVTEMKNLFFPLGSTSFPSPSTTTTSPGRGTKQVFGVMGIFPSTLRCLFPD